ncbi:MAG: ATP-binding protein [Verrucomicrobia bacterium]|nr:ATP-binding protein [Verrucomicrobiota bacterium]
MTGPDRQSRRPPEHVPLGQARAEPNDTLKASPVPNEAATEGLSFANVLHDCLASGVIFIDEKQQVVSLNARALNLLELNPDQALPSSLDYLPGALQTLARETWASGQAPPDCQVAIEAGGHRTVTLHVVALPVHPGQLRSGLVLVLNDLTPAHQIEQHIQQLDRLASVGILAAGMAHEIKNALVAGKTFVDLLLEKHQDAELVEVVRREIGRIDAIVSRMRKFTGPARSDFGEVRLHEILEHSLHLVQPQLEDKRISLNRSLLASPDVLHGDDYQLQQAFVNLFLNALEAMGPNGTLSVATEILRAGAALPRLADGADRPQLRLTITDNGSGISPENLARLFEPFFTTKPNGTGLGLLITRRIIQDHRGVITAQSAPGKGTSFQILFPASPDSA